LGYFSLHRCFIDSVLNSRKSAIRPVRLLGSHTGFK